MENKKSVSKGLIFVVIVIVLLVGAAIGGAFYLHLNQTQDVEEKTLDGGAISLTYVDEVNLFTIENAIPTSDLVGTVSDSAEMFFDFTVKTTIEEANEIEYEIILVKDETVSTALNENIKVYLEKSESGTYVEVAGPEVFTVNDDLDLDGDAMSIYKTSTKSSGNDNYRLRIWLSDTAVYDASELQNFGVKVAIDGKAK